LPLTIEVEARRFVMASTMEATRTVIDHEAKQVKQANDEGRVPVVFVHGSWLLPSSWDRWAKLFEKNGYTALTPGWPDDPETVAEAKAHPEVFANKSVGEVADHFEEVIVGLKKKPAIIGHSFGGCSRRSSRVVGERPCRSRSTRRLSEACCRCRSRR